LNTGDGEGALRSRRSLLQVGLGVLLLLILTSGWFIARTAARELAVARLQSDFVAAVSHEFRSPLTALCQLSELLMRNRVANDDDRRQYYELLNSESHRLRRLVESLLNYGRLDSGRMRLRLEELDASALVRQSATEFVRGPQARGHRLEVTTHAERSIVYADEETLRCVLWNLFDNAVKYSPDCSTVWVELARSGARLEIKVRDRGLGIPRAEHRRSFEKFVRGRAARASNVRGTGIGLALARQIVRAHGGDITLESAPGQGSTFCVVLPERPA
jgi:signal transduction histidine kinase